MPDNLVRSQFRLILTVAMTLGSLICASFAPAFAVTGQPYVTQRPILSRGVMIPFDKKAYEEFIDRTRQTLRSQSFTPWQWQRSRCQDCAIVIFPVKPNLETGHVYEFLRALQDEKPRLLALYGSDPQEYNLLAQMAVGILGRESEFFQSPRYIFKESAPWAIALIKVIQIYIDGSNRDPSPNSRGPTQIKIIPPAIVEHYRFTEDELHIPRNAAVATMGYLIEALKELKRRVTLNDLTFITPDNYVDFLPYIYFGSKAQLLNGRATPEQNIYIRDMKRYMQWIEIYEGPPHSLQVSSEFMP